MVDNISTRYEGPERRQHPDWPCKGNCGDHSGHEKQLDTLTDQMDHLIEMPETVGKLTGRVNVLILVFCIMGASMLAGVGYTFTAIGSFKEKYAEDREQDKDKLSELINDIKTANADFRWSIKDQISELTDTLDERLDNLEKANAVLNATQSLKHEYQEKYPSVTPYEESR